MRILQVIHQFLPEYTGGTEQYTADLARRLRDRGHEVAIFTGGSDAGARQWEGISVITVPGGLHGPRGQLSLFSSTFGHRGIEGAFASLLQALRPDVVHFQHLLGLSSRLPRLARKFGAATCFTLHDYWFMCPKSQLIDHIGAPCTGPVMGINCSWCAAERLGKPQLLWGAPLAAPLFMLRQQRVKRAFAEVDVLLAPSQFVADFAVRAGLPRDRIERVDFGIPSLAGQSSAPVQRAPDAPLRALFLGAISWSKGAHVLVQAGQWLNAAEVQVDVFGDLGSYPDYSKKLMKMSSTAPIRLRGQASREEVSQALASSDVLVAPSLWYENAPLVISEAFSMGLPVVASNVGALAEKVRHGVDGLLFPAGDAKALASTLIRLARDPVLLQILRAGIQNTATREQHIDRMIEVYNSLLAKQSHGEQVSL